VQAPVEIEDNGGEAGALITGDDALPCIAPAIAQSCALVGCHDSTTREHGMDLSSGSSIYAAWIDRTGFDHCRNTPRPRIVPGDPEASFVYQKITNALSCETELSNRMPPPPLDPLAEDAIEAVRAWILAGAERDCSENQGGNHGGGSGGVHAEDGGSDAGGAVQTGGAQHEGGGGGESGVASGSGGMSGTTDNGGQANGGEGGTGDPWDPFYCDASHPCPFGLVCAGNSCGETLWQCVSHFDPEDSGTAGGGGAPDVLAHPCPPETAQYCGCDGVTFEALRLCPDRPYVRAGACDDGYNCDAYDSSCEDAAPSCMTAEAPAVVDECFGDCVPTSSCRCDYDWECPDGNVCDVLEQRCGPMLVERGVQR
jgi:hypothetical protein